MTDHQLSQFAASLRVKLFSTRDNMPDAMNYAYDLIESLPTENRIAAFTALHVVMNTIADQLTKE
jgi:hypothetical protein